MLAIYIYAHESFMKCHRYSSADISVLCYANKLKFRQNNWIN